MDLLRYSEWNMKKIMSIINSFTLNEHTRTLSNDYLRSYVYIAKRFRLDMFTYVAILTYIHSV